MRFHLTSSNTGFGHAPIKSAVPLKYILLGGSVMLFEIGVIVGGCVAHMLLSNGQTSVKKESKPDINTRDLYEKETYEYFTKLPVSAQEHYFSYNLDLKDYANELTTDKYINAKVAARIARRMDKSFTNIDKRY